MYYIPHHFIFLPMVGVALGYGIYHANANDKHQLAWILFSISCFFILYLALMLRQHYALGNQDRIIRLEFRLRYYELAGKPANAIEKQLNFKQIAGLRFASDDQFLQLIEKTIREDLDADKIKKEVRNWQADEMRV